MRWLRLVQSLPVAVLGLLAPCVAFALTVEVTEPAPTLVGETVTFEAKVTDPVGVVQYRWILQTPRGVELNTDFVAGLSRLEHTFAEPGNYKVDVRVLDETPGLMFGAGDAFAHTVHWPLTPQVPTASTTIVYDPLRDRVYNVNPDNDTITATDAAASPPVKQAELSVYKRPEALAIAPDGRLWVIHRDDYAVAIVNLDTFQIEDGFRLPYASQPVGVAMSPTGDAAYVTLSALGVLLKLDPFSGAELGQLEVGASARGVSVSQDGKQVFVTRFISPEAHGEVVLVDGPALKVTKRIQLLPDEDPCLEGDQAGRGLPNFVFSVGLSPDGRQGWYAAKKDNILRGPTRDGLNLSSDNTVRPMIGVIDLAMTEERREFRLDLDDRNLPSQVVFSPLGNYAFIPLTGNDKIAVRDVYLGAEEAGQAAQLVTEIPDAGKAPIGVVLVGGRLFVHAFLSRSIVVFDVNGILSGSADTEKIAEIPVVAKETLAPEVLRGKQLFYNSEDKKMANAGYVSCASCHFEGFEDGRVWDFTRRGGGTEPVGGVIKPVVRNCPTDVIEPEPAPTIDDTSVSLREGLRNTTSLLGRRGLGHGPIHWSGNFDEIQDFECEIRLHFGGGGFIPQEVYGTEKCSDPLGTPTAALSTSLDDLAAYVSSLDRVHRSPFRNADGSLTDDGEAGRLLFTKLGCDFCHVGSDFTDSARKILHDVGTLKPTSGMRSGGPLLGIDTPTLLGVWETAPYLHDGSAPTLRDVLTTANPNDAHGFVSSLSESELGQLVAYLQQIDDEEPPTTLPFEAEPVATVKPTTGCACQLPATQRTSPWQSVLFLAPFAALCSRRKRRSALGVAAGLAAVSLVLGCSAAPPEQAPRQDWEQLPPLRQVDQELRDFPRRDAQYQALCAAKKSDAFVTAFCANGRPNITGFSSLLEFLGLDEDRAFALTGNSTSLVAMNVSAINPRIIIFPRVDSSLERPETMTALGFVRGEPFVEIVSRDSVSNEPNFYLFHFEQRCAYEDTGCDLTSLLTEEIEHDWQAYSVYSEEELENTSFACTTCHQPGGPGTAKILRMQELAAPWLHWFPQRFVRRTDSDRILTEQFLATHDVDSQYGGIPIQTIATALDEGSSAQLEALLRAEGFADQPNVFDPRIEAEAKENPDSPLWQAHFELTLRGESIAVPYPLADVTDPALRAAAVASYRGVATGAAARNTLLDIREVFSPDAMEKLGFIPQPAADGRTVLVQMCSRCHDGRADSSISRSHFNILQPESMPANAKLEAIARLQRAPDADGLMPPWRAGRLTPEAIQAAILWLSTP